MTRKTHLLTFFLLQLIVAQPLIVHSTFAQSAFAQSASNSASDVDVLLRMHEAVIQAHLNKDAAAWTALEADTTISANNGEVTRLDRANRLSSRQRYLERTTFEGYRDVKPPIVEISDDGTLGWVIVEVEIIGWTARMDGTIEDVSNTWAWIELYKKEGSTWKMVGNVSNQKSLE